MNTIVVKSYAKINVSLNVIGKENDGYHKLDMVMLPLELHDSILITKLKNHPNNAITIDDYSIHTEKLSTVETAINKLQQKYKFKEKFSIFVHKNIPIQSGLGGGSSNAAFTVKAINDRLNLGANTNELEKICEKLGGDVPFFVQCKPSRVGGFGEIVKPIEVKNDYYCLIVKPQKGCSTREIYQSCDEMNLDVFDIEKVVESLKTGDDESLAKCIGNSLEKPAIQKVPEIVDIKNKMKDLGLKIVLMTGSGSSVFALSTDKKMIKKCAKAFDENVYTVITTKVLK